MDTRPLPSDTAASQQPQPQYMRSSVSQGGGSPTAVRTDDKEWSRVVMDAPENPPYRRRQSNGHIGSPPPRRHRSPQAITRVGLPWSQVVLEPDSPPAQAARSQMLPNNLLRPQHQDSPRISLEDLLAAEPPIDDDIVEACSDPETDEGDADLLSISSSVYRGHMEHGRRYAQDSDYIAPSDEKQFESMVAGHLMYTILESQRPNPYFRSPISKDGHHHVLDVGTGYGNWAIDVADRFENYTVHGVDLYPPPRSWVPPNCRFEVDDLSKPWQFNHKFSLIHIRLLLGAFSAIGWDRLYAEAYRNLKPGGWIEHLECDIDIQCEDGSLPPGAQLTTFGMVANDCAEQLGCPLTVFHEMRSRIENAGFVNIQEKVFKAPIGMWPRHPVYKDSGKCSLKHFKTGLSGWLLRLLTKYGNPDPWEPSKAQIWLAVLKQELDAGHHIYQNQRRIWAMKPYPDGHNGVSEHP